MSLEPGKSYDCFAESAEFGETQTGWLYIDMKYRFPDTGDVLRKRHFLANPNKSLCDSNIPVDPQNPDGKKLTEMEVLEKRYDVNLANCEFDLNKLSNEIIVKAFIANRTWTDKNGESHTGTEIKSIWPKNGRDGNHRNPPPDRDALVRKFGAVLRAGHAAASRGAPAVAKPNTPPPEPTKPAPPKTPAAPSKTAQTSTMDECWTAFCNAHKNVDEATLYTLWYDFLKKELGHQKQESVTPQEWGKIKAAIAAIGVLEDPPF